MTERARFKQIDVTRAVRGAIEAGMTVELVEIAPDGKISVQGGVGAS